MIKSELITLINGKITTLSEKIPHATSIGIMGERIVAVGSDTEVLSQMPMGSQVIDLHGKSVIPGLIDAHAHLMWYGGNLLRWADLTEARSISEIQERLRFQRQRMQQQNRSGERWVLGARFDHEILAEKRFPTRQELDQVAPDCPVVIVRLCYHAMVANSRALELCGIQSESGLLTENEADPIWAQIPEGSPYEMQEAARLAIDQAVSVGLTTVHCVVSNPDEIRALMQLHAQNELKIRLRIQIPHGMLDAAEQLGLRSDFGDFRFRYGSIKIFSDGSMGARTAALTAAYTDDPSTTGTLIHSHDELTDLAVATHQAGFQLAIHAIGDRAIDESLDAIEAALSSDSNSIDRRHRIEHASILRPDQIQRMARLGVIACVQPQFATTDFWTHERVGPERLSWIYPFKSLLNGDVHLAGGSDCPVEALNPFQGIQRAMLRNQATQAEQLTLDEALRLFTLGGAAAGFEEDDKGSLESGKLADLLVLPHGLDEVDPSQIEQIRPDLVIVGGKVVLGELSLNQLLILK
jgi:predicted amidohydrolase YtcJ